MSIESITAAPTPDGACRVLHVDDEEQQTNLLASYLERLNDRLTVLTATDPTATLDRIEADGVDCVVCDYQMPAKNGLAVLRDVRDRYPNLPFFLFTARGSEEVASDAIDAGVTSYIQKGGTEVFEQLENRITAAIDRRESERMARVAKERIIELYEQTDGFYVIDEDWTVQYWNDTISERVGLDASAVVGHDFWDLFPEARETKVYDHFSRSMDEREETSFEVEYEPHGYWAEIRVYPVEPGLFVHSRDITEKKEREAEHERRNKILQSFAHTVSHDLRNPLSVAEGNLELAQETGDFEHLEEVAAAHNRMQNLIDELLRLARGEDLGFEPVSVESVARDAWGTVSATDQSLVIDGDVVVDADGSQLQRLLENLFWNAIDHGDATTIRVGPLDTDGFYVEDDGVGIPKEDREAVFDSGFSTDDGSPGYGLSIVDGIVATHDWSITVTEGADGGARFEITVDD